MSSPALPHIPDDIRRIVLLNPTRYLGNLLIAGGLIQEFARQCQARNVSFLLVLDAAFADLVASAFPGVNVLFYPRQQIARASIPAKLWLYSTFVLKIRVFKADLAFNLEEDTLTSRLTRHSGAGFRLGCSPRHARGYDYVLPIQYADRPESRRHRWYSYREVFAALDSHASAPAYLNLAINQADASVINKLDEHGLAGDQPFVAIHASATKDYKKWPEAAFARLCLLLQAQGRRPVLIGAGVEDKQRCDRIVELVSSSRTSTDQHEPARDLVNLCNVLSLHELAQLFCLAQGIVGNDSGPFHLAAAQRLPGVVIFGPSDAGIWGPLGECSEVMQRRDLCDPGCSRRLCLADYRCLRGITAESVLDSLLRIIDRNQHEVAGSANDN